MRILDSLIVPPAMPPVTVDFAKQHIRALGSADDLLVEGWIWAAAGYLEEQTGRQFAGTCTREAWLDAFPSVVGAPPRYGRIELPRPPLQAVVSVTYIAGDGTETVFEDTSTSPATQAYHVTAPAGDYARPGTIEPASGYSWPQARCESGAVRIRYTCGYGPTADDTPPLVRNMICSLVAYFDQFRVAVHEARRGQVLELPYGIAYMMQGFKYASMATTVLRDPSHAYGYGSEYWPGMSYR
jgi:uncharacterized phiE125 gp8 family phage protein